MYTGDGSNIPELDKNEVDEIVELYKSIHPHVLTPSSAIVRKKSSSNVLISVWNQRNLERGSNIKIQKTMLLDSAFQSCIELDAVDVSQRLLCSYSKSKNLRAIIHVVHSDDVKNKTKQYLDVWNEEKSLISFDFTALDIHGPVYDDDKFGCLDWSPQEDKIVYVAEKKPPKVAPFYQQTAKTESSSDKSETRMGEQYVYEDDWGEQMSPKKHPVIAVCDVVKKEISVLTGVPDDISAGQVRWDPNGDGVVGVGTYHTPRRLGIVYCTNRRSCVFHLNSDEKFNILSDPEMSVFAPRFSPDGKKLVWLERHVGGPHHTVCALVKCDWATKKVTKIVDFVDSVIRTKNGKNFYGIFSGTLPPRCWTSDSRYVLLSTSQKYRTNSYAIDIEDGCLWDIGSTDESESTSVMDVSENDFVVCSKSSFSKSAALAWLHIPSTVTSLSDAQWNCITQHNITDTSIISRFDVIDLSTEEERCHALYYGPTSAQPLSVPLILYPHGGPHSSIDSAYHPNYHFLTRLGYGVLFVNYRGSIGCGKNFLEALRGNVGSMDVQDCYCALQNALRKFPWLDPKRVVLYGGSHGGFLVTHLSSQYPNEFRAVVARNPVVIIPAKVYTTDIPDQVAAAGSGQEYKGIASVMEDEESWEKMTKLSPFYNIKRVKAPTLLLIGKKDLRVSPSQGLSYFRALKELKIPTKAMYYDDNHSLSSVPVEMDSVINAALWLARWMKRQ